MLRSLPVRAQDNTTATRRTWSATTGKDRPPLRLPACRPIAENLIRGFARHVEPALHRGVIEPHRLLSRNQGNRRVVPGSTLDEEMTSTSQIQLDQTGSSPVSTIVTLADQSGLLRVARHSLDQGPHVPRWPRVDARPRERSAHNQAHEPDGPK